MARIEDVHAGRSGRVDVDDKAVELSVVELGQLHVPSGRLGAADPFVNLADPLTTPVPPGSHAAYVTLADVSEQLDGSHLREAYLSLRVAEGEPVRVEVVVPEGVDASELDDDGLYGVPVDAGTVAFVDADAVGTGMPEGDWYNDVFDPGAGGGWFGLMDDPSHLREGAANIRMPLATEGENVVLSHSGWGDGVYPVLKTFDADGNLLGVHIDLLVVAAEGDDEDAG